MPLQELGHEDWEAEFLADAAPVPERGWTRGSTRGLWGQPCLWSTAPRLACCVAGPCCPAARRALERRHEELAGEKQEDITALAEDIGEAAVPFRVEIFKLYSFFQIHSEHRRAKEE